MLAAVLALWLMLMRAGVTLLAVAILPLALPEYHSYEQQAQHLRVVLNQPRWLIPICIALFLPCPYSSLSLVRPEVQYACRRQSSPEGKCKKTQDLKNTTTQSSTA